MAAARPSIGLAVALAAAAVVLSAAPRIALAAGTLPSSVRPFIWSDVYATYVLHLSGGRIPYVDTFFDYPPGIGYLAGLFVRVSGDVVSYVVMWTAVAAVAAGATAFVLAQETTPSRAVVFWSLSPQLLMYGGANFDVIVVLLLVAAVALARRGRTVASFVVLGIGTVVKLFPVVVAPLEFARLRRERALTPALAAISAFTLTVAVLAAPSLAAPHPSTEGVAVQTARTNFDSAWGLVLAGAGSLGLSVEPIVFWLGLVGFLVTYAVVLRRTEQISDPARLALLGVLTLLIWTRLYSPQYSLWAIPFFALLPIPVRAFGLLALADIAVFATVYPLTQTPWRPSDAAPTILFGVLAAGIVLRHVALIWMWLAAQRTE